MRQRWTRREPNSFGFPLPASFALLLWHDLQMVSIDEELAAAEQTQAALSASSPDVATLRNAKDIAIREITIFPSDGPLNDARYRVGIVLSFVIHALKAGTLTQEKIAEAKGAIEAWMNLLKAKPDAQPLPATDA